jgi:hypothetical protein
MSEELTATIAAAAAAVLSIAIYFFSFTGWVGK